MQGNKQSWALVTRPAVRLFFWSLLTSFWTVFSACPLTKMSIKFGPHF